MEIKRKSSIVSITASARLARTLLLSCDCETLPIELKTDFSTWRRFYKRVYNARAYILYILHTWLTFSCIRLKFPRAVLTSCYTRCRRGALNEIHAECCFKANYFFIIIIFFFFYAAYKNVSAFTAERFKPPAASKGGLEPRCSG